MVLITAHRKEKAMSDSVKERGGPSSNTIIIGVLIAAMVGGTVYGYMQLKNKDEEIAVMVQDVMDLQQDAWRLDAAKRKATMQRERAQDELAEIKELGLVPSNPIDMSDIKPYENGDILEGWKVLHIKGEGMKKRFGGDHVEGEELQNLIMVDDFNGVRGPDIEEIKAFESMMSSGDFPLLHVIYNLNLVEFYESRDIGKLGGPFDGVQNLLAFYATVGDEPSIEFLKTFLETPQLSAIFKSKFDGTYYYDGSAAVVKGIEARISSNTE